jgi:hypothetical protein
MLFNMLFNMLLYILLFIRKLCMSLPLQDVHWYLQRYVDKEMSTGWLKICRLVACITFLIGLSCVVHMYCTFISNSPNKHMTCCVKGYLVKDRKTNTKEGQWNNQVRPLAGAREQKTKRRKTSMKIAVYERYISLWNAYFTVVHP